MSARYFEGISHASAYAKFRPTAPNSLISTIIAYLRGKYKGPLHYVADVGCGSGQSTHVLSPHFSNVIGLDISEAQVGEAIKKNTANNVTFKNSPAEVLPFKNESFQLVTAGQACHWFDLPKFYKESDRILVPNGVLALYGYNFPRPSYNGLFEDELTELLNRIYISDTCGMWGKERIYVDNAYTNKEFSIPYDERVRSDDFIEERKASVLDLVGYITSWSGFQKFKQVEGEQKGDELLNNFLKNVMAVTGADTSPEDTELILRFRFFLIMGRKPPS